MGERRVDYCCPAAVEAYPAPCPEHGQDRPDVEVVDDPGIVLISPGGWCAPSERRRSG